MNTPMNAFIYSSTDTSTDTPTRVGLHPAEIGIITDTKHDGSHIVHTEPEDMRDQPIQPTQPTPNPKGRPSGAVVADKYHELGCTSFVIHRSERDHKVRGLL